MVSVNENQLPLQPSLLSSIYSATTDESNWVHCLSAIREICHCDLATLILTIPMRGLEPKVIYDDGAFLAEEERLKAIHESQTTEISCPFPLKLKKSGDICRLDEVISPSRIETSNYFTTFLEPCNIRYQIVLLITAPNGCEFQLALMNSASSGDFDNSHKEFLAELHPHLENALSIFSLLSKLEHENNILSRSMDDMGIGILMLNQNQKIISANGRSCDILEPITLPGSLETGLRFLKIEHQRKFKAAFEKVHNTTSPSNREVVQISCPDGNSINLLVARALKSSNTDYGAEPNTIIYVSDNRAYFDTPHSLIGELFGLTLSESRVAVALAAGSSITQSAKELGLAETTVRSYSKSIYAKLGVNGQVELVRTLLNSVAHFG